MPLNLISDRWIPAIRDGERITLRPDEIAREGVVRLDWPRGDLNLACLELLIGLVFLADPPCHDADWHERYETPDPGRLRGALKPFTPHFELTGDGPRFLQDMEQFRGRGETECDQTTGHAVHRRCRRTHKEKKCRLDGQA